ncbi:hypothetical protein Droror1_Dr00015252 [Drosera rotundifolia]
MDDRHFSNSDSNSLASFCSCCFRLLIVLSLLCFQSRAETIGSVLFLDSPTHEYLRSSSPDGLVQMDSMSALEVGAAVSVLLGFAPSETLSTSGSTKLNKILIPNPFDRPRHVLMLEIGVAKGAQVIVDSVGASFTRAIKNNVIRGSDNAQIELPGEVVISWLDGTDFDPYADIADKEINDFASWLGGSYVANEEPLTGALTISLPTNLKVHLQMSKKSDKEFITNLISLIHHIRSAIELQQDVSGSASALMTGYFHGIKALQMEYGSTEVAQGGMELFTATISKIFDSLQSRYKGQIVGVILFSQSHSSESNKMLDVVVASPASPRWLEEVTTSLNTTDVEVALVRNTLAWTAGILLLISAFIGVYLLVNMPLTKDTLLDSNVKLD